MVDDVVVLFDPVVAESLLLELADDVLETGDDAGLLDEGGLRVGVVPLAHGGACPLQKEVHGVHHVLALHSDVLGLLLHRDVLAQLVQEELGELVVHPEGEQHPVGVREEPSHRILREQHLLVLLQRLLQLLLVDALDLRPLRRRHPPVLSLGLHHAVQGTEVLVSRHLEVAVLDHQGACPHQTECRILHV